MSLDKIKQKVEELQKININTLSIEQLEKLLDSYSSLLDEGEKHIIDLEKDNFKKD